MKERPLMTTYLQRLYEKDPKYYLPDKKDQSVEIVLNVLYARIHKRAMLLEKDSYSENHYDCIEPMLEYISKKCMTFEVCQIACAQSSGNWRFIPAPNKLFPNMKSPLIDFVYNSFYDKWNFHKFLSYESLFSLSDSEKTVIDAYVHMANLCLESEKLEKRINDGIRKNREAKRNSHELDRYYAYWDRLPADDISMNSTIKYPVTKYPDTNLCPIMFEMDDDSLNMNISYSSCDLYNSVLLINNNRYMPVYYISDMHLECQLNLEDKTLPEIKDILKSKADELSKSMAHGNGLVVIAGDTANSAWLFGLFMNELYRACHYSDIVSVLGNHELLDFNSMSSDINEVVDRYADTSGICILHNALRVKYHGNEERILHDYNILEYSDEKISDICKNSTQIILGGIGFSGYEPIYNTNHIAWGNVVTTPEQEKAESDKFKKIYDKILRCASNETVIVLTHTPMNHWHCAEYEYNPNWIYINGHTHRNEIVRKENGITVLSDNQIGYEQKAFSFKSVPVKGWYDPFKEWNDGVYKITKAQYEIFNRGRGISSSFDRPNYQLYMIKRDTVYMFFCEGKNLSLLSGGSMTKAKHELNYYFENLLLYQQTVEQMFKPYNAALAAISSDIRRIGGAGTVHGCIVDIDFYNHVYLNPFDGCMTFYYATDMTNKIVFPNLESLLKENCNHELYDQYILCEKKCCPALWQKPHKRLSFAAQEPELVLDTSMYKPSKIMRKIQYIFDQNVVRVWNDEILKQAEKFEIMGYQTIEIKTE